MRLVASVFLILGVLGGIFGSPAGVTRAYAQSRVISEVIVEGVQRVEPETVRSYLLIRPGDPMDPGRVNRSLKSLFATGLFADVSITSRGTALVVTVVENPVINRIAFEGNLRIDDEDLSQEVSLRSRVIYTRTKVQNDVRRMLELYRRKGRFAAVIEPKVIQLPQNRIDLAFEIDEGPLSEIQKIRFVGNRAFDDDDLLEVLLTKESRWYRFLSSDDNYDPDRVAYDRELLRRYYLEHGYADFKVSSATAELTADRRSFFLTFSVDEGPRYRYGKVDVKANLRDLNEADIKSMVGIKAGDWYSLKALTETIDTITDKVGNMGYAFVDVAPMADRDPESRTIDITFDVKEGPRVFVERIDITGNVRTADEVIRREFKLVEGDAYNTNKINRSKKNVDDLDFFKTVKVDQIEGSEPDKTVVKVDVEEKSTGSFSIGAGYSTTEGALATTSIRERNLLGLGQELSLSLGLSQQKTQIDLSFTEPYFLDRDLRAGFDLFQTVTDQQDESSYDSVQAGLAFRAGYPVTEYLSQNWRFGLRQSEVSNVASDASIYIKAEAGEKSFAELSHSLFYDRLNSRKNPTDGYYMRMSNDLGGLGEDSFFKTTVGAGHYYSLADQWVLSVRGGAGYVVGLGADVGLLDRFPLGGDDLRGFASRGVGPRDPVTSDALGGEWMYRGTAEVSFPIGLPNELGITAKVFTDFGSAGKLETSGSVYDTGSLRASVGAGIAWQSPVGPISIDYGVPVIDENFDRTEAIRVNFGTFF